MFFLLITRQVDYTLRIVRALHRHGLQSAAAIAEREHMQKAITLKLLKKLSAAGIVESRRGVNGGYLLTRSCDELTLLDLFCAAGEPPLLNRCQNPDYRCENHPDRGCGLCREFCRIQTVLEAELSRTPLNAVFSG